MLAGREGRHRRRPSATSASAPGFGQVAAAGFVRHGIGVHHAGHAAQVPAAGRAPRPGRATSRSSAAPTRSAWASTCPIRTVLFTQLCKYDGTSSRLLTAREFHQIAGRAGRAGFDTVGYVVVAGARARDRERAGAGQGGRRRQEAAQDRRSQAADPGLRAVVEDTFTKLVGRPARAADVELHGRRTAMLLNVLDRPGDGCGAMRRAADRQPRPRPRQRQHIRRAIAMYRSLLRPGVVERLDEPDDRRPPRAGHRRPAGRLRAQPAAVAVRARGGHPPRPRRPTPTPSTCCRSSRRCSRTRAS